MLGPLTKLITNRAYKCKFLMLVLLADLLVCLITKSANKCKYLLLVLLAGLLDV